MTSSRTHFLNQKSFVAVILAFQHYSCKLSLHFAHSETKMFVSKTLIFWMPPVILYFLFSGMKYIHAKCISSLRMKSRGSLVTSSSALFDITHDGVT